ncbi:MAG TPA: AsmA family protein [Pseudacidobacterium sp.]|nr:AsmA family protein [Pseudacidobacterium sp.]
MSETPRRPKTKLRIFLAAVVLLALAVVLPPLINLNRYQGEIAAAISRAIGRPVHLSSVTLRLLPRPGLELGDFVVEEDPAFGAEPALRAPSVDASIRLSSLWRGRLEIGRISLDQASVNIVRDASGHWNLGTILVQAAHIPNAPTAQRHAGQSPRFPYIEASNTRVNFKIGAEKKPFSFFNADFAMWLENPDEWRIRLEAQPARTDIDLDLADTGTLRVEGSMKRASELGDMPVSLHAEWTNAALGQISRLLLGAESGWRGNLEITGDITGSVYGPQFKTRIRITDMHRQEFSPVEPFNVDATCQGGYRQTERSLRALTCFWPISDGHLLLTGNVPDIEHPVPALHLHVQNVPAAFGLSALRLFRNKFADSVQISGTAQGDLDYAHQLTGDVAVEHLSLRLPDMDSPLAVPTLHIVARQTAPAPRKGKKSQPKPASPAALQLENADIPLGGASPLELSGNFTRRGFSLNFQGDASMERLRPIASGLHLASGIVSALAPKGEAELDLKVHGPWISPVSTSDYPVPATTTEGVLHLKNAEYQAGFLSGPVEIVSAQVSLSPTQVVVSPLAAVFQKIPVSLSVTIPTRCSGENCAPEFSLTAQNLDAASLQSALLGAGEHNELLQQILSRLERNKPQWPALNGTIHISTFMLGPLAVHDASGRLHIEGRAVQFLTLDGHAWNGVLHATGRMDASGTPKYSFDTQLTHANAAEIASMWHGERASGAIGLRAHIEAAGYSADDLQHSAQGTFQWDWTQGSLAAAPAALEHFDHWSASGVIRNAQLVLEKSQVSRGASRSDVSGEITFDRKLNLSVSEKTEQAHAAHAP